MISRLRRALVPSLARHFAAHRKVSRDGRFAKLEEKVPLIMIQVGHANVQDDVAGTVCHID
jgi:hypothetical protein